MVEEEGEGEGTEGTEGTEEEEEEEDAGEVARDAMLVEQGVDFCCVLEVVCVVMMRCKIIEKIFFSEYF